MIPENVPMPQFLEDYQKHICEAVVKIYLNWVLFHGILEAVLACLLILEEFHFGILIHQYSNVICSPWADPFIQPQTLGCVWE